MRKLRIALGLALLLVSLALLAWGLWPAAYEHHTLKIQPTEMTLPTPSSFVPWAVGGG